MEGRRRRVKTNNGLIHLPLDKKDKNSLDYQIGNPGVPAHTLNRRRTCLCITALRCHTQRTRESPTALGAGIVLYAVLQFQGNFAITMNRQTQTNLHWCTNSIIPVYRSGKTHLVQGIVARYRLPHINHLFVLWVIRGDIKTVRKLHTAYNCFLKRETMTREVQ